MATNDVPGANLANSDTLKIGCWAEHADGSLILVQGTENDQIVFQMYDLAQSPPVFYQDAMREGAFKKAFSFPPTGDSKEKFVWHDKTSFPWSRVMKTFDKPRTIEADVHDTLSAAARVAQSLRLRAQKLAPELLSHMQENPDQPKAAVSIIQRIQRAFDAFVGK